MSVRITTTSCVITQKTAVLLILEEETGCPETSVRIYHYCVITQQIAVLLTLEDDTDRLSRNVCKKLPLLAV